MQQQERMYVEFTRIAAGLNKQLRVVPVLYGSVGLSRILQDDLYPRGIDMLLPKAWLEEGYAMLQSALEEEGYSLVDEEKYIFAGARAMLTIWPIENVLPILHANGALLRTVNENGAEFQELRLSDYRRIYAWSAEQAGKRQAKYAGTLELIETLSQL